jgi:hypothetical protein
MNTLPEYIAAHLSAPFEWGRHDCITFAVGWVEISSGRKHLPDELWQDEWQAARLVKENGGLVAVLDAHFRRLPHPNYAKDGDLAIAAGVVSLVSGAHIVAPGADGLVFKPRTEAEHAWTV